MKNLDFADIDIVIIIIIAANIVSPSSIDPSAQHSHSPQHKPPKALRRRHPKPSGRGTQSAPDEAPKALSKRHPSPQEEAPKLFRLPGVMGTHDPVLSG